MIGKETRPVDTIMTASSKDSTVILCHRGRLILMSYPTRRRHILKVSVLGGAQNTEATKQRSNEANHDDCEETKQKASCCCDDDDYDGDDG